MAKYKRMEPGTPVYCMVLQIFQPEQPAEILALTVQINTEQEATAWFVGWIAGANLPFDPMRDSLEIFRYEGKGGLDEAQTALNKYVMDSAADMGVDLLEPEQFERRLIDDIVEILEDGWTPEQMGIHADDLPDTLPSAEWSDTCSMCGKESSSLDHLGMCARCRQIWNS